MKKESLDILDKLIQDKIKQIESFEWFKDSTESGKIGKSLKNIAKFELVDLNADKKRMWIPAIGIKSINTKKMNVSVPLNLGFLTKSQL